MNPYEAIEFIEKNITGRIACENNNCIYLAEMVQEFAWGDHLEIGALFGGSAILAALMRESGVIYSIDPFDGYYTGTQFEYNVDPATKLPITLLQAEENALKCGVANRIQFMIGHSEDYFPFPPNKFATAYIDGNHWGIDPMLDWMHVHSATEKAVLFDNCDDNHPAVQKAVQLASRTKGWKLRWVQGISALVVRT